MHARLTTFRFDVGDKEAAAAADPQESLRLLTEQEGCRGAWHLADEASETEATYFSLWDRKEQAQSAGDRAREGLQQLFEKYQTTLTAPPDTRVLAVVASSQEQ